MKFNKPLYETTTVVTLEEFRKLNHALSSRRSMAAILLALEALLAVLLVFSIRNHNKSSTQLYVIMLILLPFIAYLIPRYLERRMYLANETANNTVMKTQFFSDHLVQHSNRGNATVKYTELQKIIETSTNFYLLVSKSQTIIIVKNHCHPKLVDFIHEMMK
ncbi:MAG: YcxB family protein [Eubacterium sp.]|nr:YcxB family protein [Eubacterium sp.]